MTGRQWSIPQSDLEEHGQYCDRNSTSFDCQADLELKTRNWKLETRNAENEQQV